MAESNFMRPDHDGITIIADRDTAKTSLFQVLSNYSPNTLRNAQFKTTFVNEQADDLGGVTK